MKDLIKNSNVNVKKNIIYQMFCEVLGICLPLITSPYISRVLGAENLGIYSYTYSIATYFGMFAMLGVKNHGSREISKSRDSQEKINSTFSNIYFIQLFASAIVIGSYFIYSLFLTSNYTLFYIIQSLYVLSCLLDISWFFTGLEKIRLTVIRTAIIKILAFIATFVFVKEISDFWKYCLIVASSSLLSQAMLWLNFPKYAKFVKPNFVELKRQIKPMLILFIPVIAVSIYNVMDKIMLGNMSSKTELGYYENAEKIINCAKTVLTSFGAVMLPRMSRLVAERNTDQSKRYIRLSMEVVMCIAFALSFGIAGVANVFSVVYWGNEFSACGILLIGLAISLPFSGFANVIRTQYLIPNNMDNIYIISVILGAIVNAVVNVLLIPNQGAMGAVIGTICAESLVCVVQCIAIRKKVELLTYIKNSIPFLIIGGIMYLVVIFLENILPFSNFLKLIIEIGIGAFIYCMLSLIYFIVTKNEILLGIIKKLKKHCSNEK